ncbi:MAG: hypothetical protein CM15mP86_18360 [Gammaproteobacteria bacterium]|nr:MAG: hypothetical protein CM15mP86_18360 [Gammaproteobacteria bacterium]
MARSAVSRELMRMGGKPIYRAGFISDNGHQIIDIHNLPIDIPYELEEKINNIPGVVKTESLRKIVLVNLCATDDAIQFID